MRRFLLAILFCISIFVNFKRTYYLHAQHCYSLNTPALRGTALWLWQRTGCSAIHIDIDLRKRELGYRKNDEFSTERFLFDQNYTHTLNSFWKQSHLTIGNGVWQRTGRSTIPLRRHLASLFFSECIPRPVRRLSFPIEASTSEILRAIIEGGRPLYLYDFRSFLCKRLLWYELWCPNIEAGHLSPRRYSYRGDIRFEMLSQRDAVKRERPSQDLHPQERSPFFSAQYFPKYISQWGRSLNLGESYFAILVSS